MKRTTKKKNYGIMLILLLFAGSMGFSQNVTYEVFKPKLASFAALSATTSSPLQTAQITQLETPDLGIDGYHLRIKGFIKVTVTGSYTFAMASDDGSQFWLSTNYDANNKVMVLENLNYTSSYAPAEGVSVNLTANQYYYFEALLDEGSGGDFIRVGWKKPGDSNFAPVPSANLVPNVLNFEPTCDPVTNLVPYTVGAGSQTITLTGISDGNFNKAQNITVTASSSNTGVVNNLTVTPSAITSQTTANLQFDLVSHGIAEITVTLTDDGASQSMPGDDQKVIKFTVNVLDPVLNDAPSFDGVSSNIVYLNEPFNYLMLTNVDDGEPSENQQITFTYQNLNTSVLEAVESITYTTGSKTAIIKIQPKSFGTGIIRITATDNGNTGGGNINQYVKDISFEVKQFIVPGMYHEYYDVAHWQTLEDNASPLPGTTVIIQSSTTPIETLAKDFFWQRMWGYLKPTITGDYVFRTRADGDNSAFLFLSTDENPANKVQIATHGTESDLIYLEAGKTYYWMAKSADIVNPQPFYVQVAVPGFSWDFITGSFCSPDFDISKPTPPTNLRTIIKGVNDISVQWDASVDTRLAGYKVFVNGVLVKDSLTGTSYQILGLNADMDYSVTVQGFDKFGNHSELSNLLTLKTYPVDVQNPTTPANLRLTKAYDLGLEISWDLSTDNTEIRGYNLYFGNDTDPINEEFILGTTYTVTGLDVNTDYQFRVEAIDANYNKSPKSAISTFKTLFFDSNTSIPGYKKGRVTFSMEGITTSEGLGILSGYDPSSVVSRNKVNYPGFEQADKNLGKEVSGSLVYTIMDASTNPQHVFKGTKSARISGANNEWFSCNLSTFIDGSLFDYEVKFAMKKDAAYTGTIRVTLKDIWGANTLVDTVITPTTNWEVYSCQVADTYTGVERGWNLRYTYSASGTVFLDDVTFQFKDDEYLIDGNVSEFSKMGMDILKDFKPNGIRWGGIGANFEKFSDHSGYRKNNLTYADWVAMCNEVNSKAIITTGTYIDYDWYKNASTMTDFIDYIAGDGTTTMGAKRIAENGYTDLMTNSPGLAIEFGNEVWGGGYLLGGTGGTNHGCMQWSGAPALYGNWCRTNATAIKAKDSYQNFQNKIKMSYSCGTTEYGSFGSWTQGVITGDKGEIDWVAIMGYMGGNLNYTPEIPKGNSELDYHKNTVGLLSSYWSGITTIQKNMQKMYGYIKPLYMYEGNMTTNDYNARLGQAITFTDYYIGCTENGVAAPQVFALQGGQWRILEDKSLKKLPLFYTTQLFNNHCKGTVLKTQFLTNDTLINAGGSKIDIEPVSAHSYKNEDTYSVLLIARDFENDYHVQVELPDDINVQNDYKIYTISGDAFQTFDAVVDSATITGFNPDSIIVNVPKYSMVLVKFKADDVNVSAPVEGYMPPIKLVTSISIETNDPTTITANNGSITYSVIMEPNDAFLREFKLEELENTAKATVSLSSKIVKEKTYNGVVKLRVYTLDGSNLSDTLTIIVDVPGQPMNVINDEISGIKVYPNPASENLTVESPAGGKPFTVSVYSLTGVLAMEKKISSEGKTDIDVSGLTKGLYILQLRTDNNSFETKLSIIK